MDGPLCWLTVPSLCQKSVTESLPWLKIAWLAVVWKWKGLCLPSALTDTKSLLTRWPDEGLFLLCPVYLEWTGSTSNVEFTCMTWSLFLLHRTALVSVVEVQFDILRMVDSSTIKGKFRLLKEGLVQCFAMAWICMAWCQAPKRYRKVLGCDELSMLWFCYFVDFGSLGLLSQRLSSGPCGSPNENKTPNGAVVPFSASKSQVNFEIW